MPAELKKNLEEAKATGENSVAADAVSPAGGSDPSANRPADLKKKDKTGDVQKDATGVKTPEGSNDVGLKEAIDRLFGDTELSEDFKDRTTAIFEAAVNERVHTITEELEARFEEKLQEEVETVVEDLTEKLDSYLDYVVENWMTENEVAIESGFKVEMAESLFNGIKGLMTEHNISMDEDQKSAVVEMENRLTESEERYNEVLEELLSIREENDKLARQMKFNELTEGMIDTDVERFRVLAEGVSAEGIEEYSKKLVTIKEGYFTEAAVKNFDETELLEEEVDTNDKVVAMDPSVARYASVLSKYSRN